MNIIERWQRWKWRPWIQRALLAYFIIASVYGLCFGDYSWDAWIAGMGVTVFALAVARDR